MWPEAHLLSCAHNRHSGQTGIFARTPTVLPASCLYAQRDDRRTVNTDKMAGRVKALRSSSKVVLELG